MKGKGGGASQGQRSEVAEVGSILGIGDAHPPHKPTMATYVGGWHTVQSKSCIWKPGLWAGRRVLLWALGGLGDALLDWGAQPDNEFALVRAPKTMAGSPGLAAGSVTWTSILPMTALWSRLVRQRKG